MLGNSDGLQGWGSDVDASGTIRVVGASCLPSTFLPRPAPLPSSPISVSPPSGTGYMVYGKDLWSLDTHPVNSWICLFLAVWLWRVHYLPWASVSSCVETEALETVCSLLWGGKWERAWQGHLAPVGTGPGAPPCSALSLILDSASLHPQGWAWWAGGEDAARWHSWSAFSHLFFLVNLKIHNVY